MTYYVLEYNIFRLLVDRITKLNMFIEMNIRYIVKYCVDRNIDYKCMYF